ncbi:TLC domain-containing protein 3A [Coccinella septempunctata]|uniref:TLC domain-containing protein 3A n=1 Tax=Coccinella septempunctata TaxID=41139 RepID=UPI001D08D328|nr:TLC domain-containing protein 3A [Coccinella septempunctata]
MVHLNEKFADPLNTPNKNRKYIFIPLLIFVTLSSLVFSILQVKNLQWEDKISLETGLMLFVYGLIFFTASFEASNHLFFYTDTGKMLIKKFGLTQGFVMEISNKNVSAIQALFCCITGLTSTCYSCTRDMLKTSHYISEAYAWFGAAYFLYDIWSMYKVQIVVDEENLKDKVANGKVKNGLTHETAEDVGADSPGALSKFWNFVKTNPVIVGHHVFVGGFGFLVITYLRGGLGDCFFGFVFLMEASTPFVSMRSIISKMGFKNSRFYVINGLFMMISFFVFRVLMWPLVMLLYAYSVDKGYLEAIYSLPRGCKISILILMLPQLYWFFLIVKGATQLGMAKRKKKKAM